VLTRYNVTMSNYASHFSGVRKMYLINTAITKILSISFKNALQSTNKHIITGTMILNLPNYLFVQRVNRLQILVK
jgi:hypothetical protein